jgi:acetylornithine deacetylase/succinyl-diaminopimelate desuccinylase-like protein
MAEVTDSGMIFVPSPDGVSHSPHECVRWEDLEKGANLLLAALLRLAE